MRKIICCVFLLCASLTSALAQENQCPYDGLWVSEGTVVISSGPTGSITRNAGHCEINGIVYRPAPEYGPQLSCDIGWDEPACRNNLRLDAGEGWQVCGLSYEVAYRGGYKTDIRVAAFHSLSKPEDGPAQYGSWQKLHISVYAEGTQDPTDHLGARVDLRNIHLLTIPASAGADGRKRALCQTFGGETGE
jgi:hypothetical protein